MSCATEDRHEHEDHQGFETNQHFILFARIARSSLRYVGETEGVGVAIPFFTRSTTSSCGIVKLKTTLLPSAETFVLLSRTSSSFPLRVSAPAASMIAKSFDRTRA